MNFKSYSSEGFVLSRKNYGEADRILTVYSKHYGKLTLLAKGVRKPKSKKRGHIEVFSRIRFSASKTKGLDLITEAELMDSFAVIRKDLKKVAVAYFLCELVNRVMRDGERNEMVFFNMLENLDLMKNGTNLRNMRHDFIVQTLIILGFWPKGKKMDDPDRVLEEVIESKMNSRRVGQRLLN
jgi:DNA repair protein RecO (recombination protein O)